LNDTTLMWHRQTCQIIAISIKYLLYYVWKSYTFVIRSVFIQKLSTWIHQNHIPRCTNANWIIGIEVPRIPRNWTTCCPTVSVRRENRYERNMRLYHQTYSVRPKYSWKHANVLHPAKHRDHVDVLHPLTLLTLLDFHSETKPHRRKSPLILIKDIELTLVHIII